jgi:hypothetical protein
MIILAAAVFGAAYGALVAKRRSGGRADMVQYGVGFAIAFGLLGLFVTIFLERML